MTATNIKSLLLLLLIIFMGVVLRFYRINTLATFRSDQAIELNGAYEISRGKFSLIGIKTSNSEIRNGAVMYYLTVPFLLLFENHPLAGSVLQTMLSLATAAVLYLLLGKENKRTALTAAFLVAASALLVRFSRQTMLAFYPLFFSGFALWLFSKLNEKFDKKSVFALGLILGFMLQIHYSTFTVVLSALLFPFLFFELRHEFFNTKMLWAFVSSSSSAPMASFNHFVYWQKVVAGFFFGENFVFAGIFIICLLLWLTRRRSALKQIEKISLLAIASNVLFGLVFVKTYTPHYAVAAVPALVAMTAIFITGVAGRLAPLLLAIFFLINFPGYGFSDNHGWTMADGWNQSGIEKAADTIYEDALNGQFNVAMLVDAENQGWPLRYFLKIRGKEPQAADKYDRAETLYLVSEPGIDLDNIKMWELTSFGAYTIGNQWEIQNGYVLYKLQKI